MKKVLLMLFALFLLSGCELFCPPWNGDSIQPENSDEYYVKYSISSSFKYFGSIKYADVNGIQYDRTEDYNRTSLYWEVIVGPVKNDFRSHVSYSRGSANIVKIEVSKNNGPFVLKASGSESVSYTIDF